MNISSPERHNMEELRTYIRYLDDIMFMLDEMPMLNFDSEIENFYESTYNQVEKHKDSIRKRLKFKEEEIINEQKNKSTKKERKNN